MPARGDVQVVDVRNEGAIPDLPDDAVVELPARIDRSGATPIPTAPLAPEMRALVQHAKAYEELAIEAAVTGDRQVALRALMTNPLVPDVATAEGLLAAILDEGGQHLPRFWPGLRDALGRRHRRDASAGGRSEAGVRSAAAESREHAPQGTSCGMA